MQMPQHHLRGRHLSLAMALVPGGAGRSQKSHAAAKVISGGEPQQQVLDVDWSCCFHCIQSATFFRILSSPSWHCIYATKTIRISSSGEDSSPVKIRNLSCTAIPPTEATIMCGIQCMDTHTATLHGVEFLNILIHRHPLRCTLLRLQ